MFLMRNIQYTYKSTRSIIMLTTVIRALQHVMDVAIKAKKIKLTDSDAIILFFEFYKIVFLGTKFTERVLQIRVTQPQANDKAKPVVLQLKDAKNSSLHDGNNSSEEGKVVMIVDTSDAYSSSDNKIKKNDSGDGSERSFGAGSFS